MPVSTDARPKLVEGLSAGEFDAWDWPKAELTKFARLLGIPSTGTKAALTARIRSRLPAGRAATERPVRIDLTIEATMPEPTIEVFTPAPVTAAVPARPAPVSSGPDLAAHPAPHFFRGATNGLTRAQALAAWFAHRQRKRG